MTEENKMLYKSFTASMGEGEGVKQLKGYASVFGNIDSHGDIVLPGTFKKSIEMTTERPIRLFSSHSMDARDLLGTIKVMREDSKGLYFEADLSQADSAQDILTKAKEGHLAEISIGFFLGDSEYSKSDKGETIRLIKDVELVEISLVSRASNSQALVLEVKEELIEKPVIKEIIFMADEIKKNEEVSELKAELAEIKKLLNKPEKLPIAEDVVVTKENKADLADDLFVEFLNGSISSREMKREVEKKALSSVVIENGAGLIPERLHSEIVKYLDRIVRLEDYITVLTGNGPLNILDWKFQPSFSNFNEGGTITEDTISNVLGKSTLNPQEKVGMAGIPRRLERRAYITVQPLIAEGYAQAFKELKEDAIMTGTGNDEPLGIITALAAVSATTNTETITSIAYLDYNAMINVQYLIDEQYRQNAAYFVTPNAEKYLRELTGNSLPLWTNGDAQIKRPPMFAGHPVIVSQALQTGATANDSIIVFGDLKKYFLLEEEGFGLEVSDDFYFDKNKKALKMVVAFDGMPVDMNAFARIMVLA
jgi:HK97 family phage major capsid protein